MNIMNNSDHIFDNLDEMEQFFERHDLVKFIEIEMIIWVGLCLLTESIITFQNKKNQTDGFTGEFYQRGLIPVLYNLFQKVNSEEIVPNLFKKAIGYDRKNIEPEVNSWVQFLFILLISMYPSLNFKPLVSSSVKYDKYCYGLNCIPPKFIC